MLSVSSDHIYYWAYTVFYFHYLSVFVDMYEPVRLHLRVSG